MRRNLGPGDLADFLQSPTLAILATRRKDGGTMLSPVWHEWADGGFTIMIAGEDLKSRQVQREARVTVLVAEQVPPYAGFELSGIAELDTPPDAMAIAERIAIRYLGREGGLAYAGQLGDTPLQRLRVRPGAIRAWDFRDEFA
jgi:hypothetical protein